MTNPLHSALSVSTAFVYTCNEIQEHMLKNKHYVYGAQACVVIPEGANEDDYPYLATSYLQDLAKGDVYSLADFVHSEMPCRTGDGPWMLTSDDPSLFNCSSTDFEHTEVVMTFSTAAADVIRAGAAPKTITIGKGIHPIVAPEGSVRIDMKSSSADKEITLEYLTGVGQGEDEERFELTKDTFFPGTSTIILGPVTTVKVADDVTVEMTVTSFGEKSFVSAQPGFEFSLLSSGYASDFQRSLPSILVSTAYGINDDTIAYDSISITGTVTLNPVVAPTTLAIECYHKESGMKDTNVITQTAEVAANYNCSSLDITYQGNLDPLYVGRTKEVIILHVNSNSKPVLLPTEAAEPTRRTPPPTSTVTALRTTSRTSRMTSTITSTTKSIQTTSGASATAVALIPMIMALLL